MGPPRPHSLIDNLRGAQPVLPRRPFHTHTHTFWVEIVTASSAVSVVSTTPADGGRAQRPGLGQQGEAAQMAGKREEGGGGPRAGFCGCSEGCWRHAPDEPVQKEAAQHGQRRRRGKREEEKAAKPLDSPPGCNCVQTDSRAGPQPHQQNARKVGRGTVFRCSSAGHHGASRKRARRQGRTSSPSSAEGRSAGSKANVARRHSRPGDLPTKAPSAL